jgi:hypothetical protein
MGYHTVPAKILDGTKELAAWAEKASAVVRLAAASRAKSHPRKKKVVAKSKCPTGKLAA